MTEISLICFNYSIFYQNKHKWFFIYNKRYSAFLKIKQHILYTHNGICINSNIQEIKNFLNQMSLFLFTKIKFSGKGYKIKKSRTKSLGLLFNRAHITCMWWKNLIIKKLKKYKIYIKHTKNNTKIIKLLMSIRPVNIFTKKGLRVSRQVVFKKKGKK